MSTRDDRSDLLHTAKPAPARQPKPAELLFEFYRESDHSRWRCELRDHGKEFGVEAQFYQNEEFICGRRFDPRLDASRPSRALAVAWAEEERDVISAQRLDR